MSDRLKRRKKPKESKPGEPALYARPEHPLTKDYAVLALLPGVQSGKRMLVFSGLTTFGTQAAVDYVCHPDSTADLLRQITGPKGEVHLFEALLETTIGGASLRRGWLRYEYIERHA